MKKLALAALSVATVLSLSACANGSDWTPMSAGRTAGEGGMMHTTMKTHKADDSFSGSLRK